MDSNGFGQNGGLSAQAMQALMSKPPYNSLITPEKTAQFAPHNASREGFIRGVAKMWEIIQSTPETDQKHQDAINKLRTVQTSLLTQIRNAQAQANASKAQAAPSAPAQRPVAQPVQQTQQQPPMQAPQQANAPPIVQPALQPTQQPGSQANPQRPPQEPPQQFMQQAMSQKLIVPPSHVQDPQTWLYETRRKLALALWKQRQAQEALSKIGEMLNQAKQQGRDVQPEILTRKGEYEDSLNNVQNYLRTLKQQQDTLKQNGQGLDAASLPNGQPAQAANNVPVGAQPRPPSQHQNLPPNAAVDAARQQAARPPSSPQVPGPNSGQQPQGGQFTGARPGQPNQFTQQPTQSPQPTAPPTNQTQSYTHEQAMTAVNKSYSSNGATATQTAGQTPSQSFQRAESDNKLNRGPGPMSKPYNMPPPQPVQMGPSRPTMMTPNNGPTGMLGQPAIAATPTYNLHGQGDHVLERGKLHELVRQVTGAGDGAVGEHQGLQPEVEESILMLADEFIDNVVTAACKLAKLRGSQTLELRDIQLVLERQYNIRIPGYGIDEVRTVRKVQPAPAFYQKLNAINAAKVVGKTTDI